MAYLQIKSTNPDFSHSLKKNPSSGMTLREFRRGTFFGWFSDNNQTYNLYFKDGDDEVSFKKSNDDEFEYNDVNRYNSPLVIQGAVNDFLRHFTNGEVDETYDPQGKYEHEIIINQLDMFNIKYLTLIERYYPQFTIQFEQLCERNYKVSLKTTTSLRELVNFSYILSIFYHCLTEFDGAWVDEGEVARYVKILNNLDSPYFIRYVVKSRVVRSFKKFENIKSELEKCSYQNIELVYGDTHTQRSNFIEEQILGNYELVDLGCNNMASYGIKFARKMGKNEILYHAIDIDEEALFKAEKRVNNNALDNVIFYKSLSELIDSDPTQKFDVIISEVFEHIELKEDTKMIKSILKNLNINKILITTPNKDFNIYYNFTDDQTRLDDHVFEMTEQEFQDYFIKLLKPFDVKFEFFNIGDKVNGITPTQGIVISK